MSEGEREKKRKSGEEREKDRKSEEEIEKKENEWRWERGGKKS